MKYSALVEFLNADISNVEEGPTGYSCFGEGVCFKRIIVEMGDGAEPRRVLCVLDANTEELHLLCMWFFDEAGVKHELVWVDPTVRDEYVVEDGVLYVERDYFSHFVPQDMFARLAKYHLGGGSDKTIDNFALMLRIGSPIDTAFESAFGVKMEPVVYAAVS